MSSYKPNGTPTPEQEAIIFHNFDDPLLVVAGAGTGKTYSAKERVGHAVHDGIIRPEKLLFVSFTNKAVNEMIGRLVDTVGDSVKEVVGRTIHSFCRWVVVTNYKERLAGRHSGPTWENVLTGPLQKAVLQAICENEKLEFGPGYAARWIMDAKKHRIDPTIAYDWYRDNLMTMGLERWIAAKIAGQLRDASRWYEDVKVDPFCLRSDYVIKRLKGNRQSINMRAGFMDFTDMIVKAEQVLEDRMARAWFQDQIDYVVIDEAQDTGPEMRVLETIARSYDGVPPRMTAVGDAKQCVIEGTLITLASGKQVPVEQVNVGMKVLAGYGHGKIGSAEVTNTFKRRRWQHLPVVRITLESGEEVTTTPEHTHFAGFDRPDLEKDFTEWQHVYLMEKDGVGFRVGKTSRTRSHGRHGYATGYMGRLANEGGDRLWVLDAFADESEARFWEQFYSVKYGIPTWLYRARAGSMYTDVLIGRLFQSLNTECGAHRLLNDLDMDYTRPHHIPRCTSGTRKRNFNITLCQDSRYKPLHRYAIHGSDQRDAVLLEELGLPVRDSKGSGWRVEATSANLGDIYDIHRQVTEKMDVVLIERARLTNTGQALHCMPASHVRPGMMVAVKAGNELIKRTVVKVEREDYTGYVYDLEVERCHNFIANGIATHNSIFKFRGAVPDKILYGWQERHGPTADVKFITVNWRSENDRIVSAANHLARDANPDYNQPMQPRPDAAPGTALTYTYLADSTEESHHVVDTIADYIDGKQYKPGDMAIIYRTNAQSRAFEDRLLYRSIPYVVVNATGFFDRKVVKDLLAFLKLMDDPNDTDSLFRIRNMPSKARILQSEKTTRFMGPKYFDGVHGAVRRLQNAPANRLAGLIPWRNDPTYSYPYLALKELASGMPDWKAANTEDLIDTLEFLFEMADGEISPAQALLRIYDHTYREWVKRREGIYEDAGADADPVFEMMDELVDIASRYTTVGAFLGYVASTQKAMRELGISKNGDNGAGEDDAGRVTLLTGHKAKGLEWPCVFVVGVSDGLVPHVMSKPGAVVVSRKGSLPVLNKPDLDAELNWLYVAITRGERETHVSGISVYRNRVCPPTDWMLDLVGAGYVERMAGERVEFADVCAVLMDAGDPDGIDCTDGYRLLKFGDDLLITELATDDPVAAFWNGMFVSRPGGYLRLEELSESPLYREVRH
jgi:DNA helicase-2/ATP-dependent DNA helicase PcrA